MVKNTYKKTGFTLIEIIIALVILALFFVASMKILTVKPRRQYLNSMHGMYECYYEAGKLKYHKVEEEYNQKVKDTDNNNYCTFEPSKNVAFYNIIVVMPAESGDKVYTNIQPSINRELKLYPSVAEIWDSDDDIDIDTCRAKLNNGEEDENCSNAYISYYTIAQAELETMTKDELITYLKTTTRNKSKLQDKLLSYTDGAIVIKW